MRTPARAATVVIAAVAMLTVGALAVAVPPGVSATGHSARAASTAVVNATANADMVQVDSLVAQRSDGTLIVGRGVPDSWVRTGQVIKLANLPASAGRRIGLMVSTRGISVTLSLSGARPAGAVVFQIPAFVGNIAGASTGTVNEKSGTVTLAPGVCRVTVRLRHGERG